MLTFSNNGTGITVAQALPNATGVVAIDVTLDKISELLQNKLQELGAYNSSTQLWVSEHAPLGLVIGVGRGEAAVNLQRLKPIDIPSIKQASEAISELATTMTSDALENEIHNRFGHGIDHQEITTRTITGGATAAGLSWWLVQSMQFQNFIRQVQVEGR